MGQSNQKETLVLLNCWCSGTPDGIINVRYVCVTVSLFMTITVLLMRSDAIPLQMWPVSSLPGNVCFVSISKS